MYSDNEVYSDEEDNDNQAKLEDYEMYSDEENDDYQDTLEYYEQRRRAEREKEEEELRKLKEKQEQRKLAREQEEREAAERKRADEERRKREAEELRKLREKQKQRKLARQQEEREAAERKRAEEDERRARAEENKRKKDKLTLKIEEMRDNRVTGRQQSGRPEIQNQAEKAILAAMKRDQKMWAEENKRKKEQEKLMKAQMMDSGRLEKPLEYVKSDLKAANRAFRTRLIAIYQKEYVEK